MAIMLKATIHIKPHKNQATACHNFLNDPNLPFTPKYQSDFVKR